MSDFQRDHELRRVNNLANGSVYINDTAIRGTTGAFAFCEILCVRNCQFKVLEVTNMDNDSDITTGTSFIAGTRIRGKIARIQMKAATNIAIAYYGDSAGRVVS